MIMLKKTIHEVFPTLIFHTNKFSSLIRDAKMDFSKIRIFSVKLFLIFTSSQIAINAFKLSTIVGDFHLCSCAQESLKLTFVASFYTVSLKYKIRKNFLLR